MEKEFHAIIRNSYFIIQEGKRRGRLLLFRTHHISETISSPFRGAFHLSLTVLSAIDLCICLALDGGPPGFGPDYTCPTLLRILLPLLTLSSTGLSPSMAARSRDVRLETRRSDIGVLQPPPHRLPRHE